MAKKKIGFIGLGAMGSHMAKNLIKAGYELTVHDLNPQAVKEIVSSGAKEAKSCAEAAKGVEVVITMLPADDEVKAVCLGQGGVLEGAKPGTVLIDMSSIAPHTSKQVAAEAQKKGIKFLDAPVSGGTVGAEKATLTIMVGGDKALLDEHMEILQVMGKTIYHVGDVGMGETVKMVNQMLVGINLAGIVEALVMGTKLGVAPEVLYKIIRASSGNSFMLDSRVPNFIFTGNFTQPGFAVDLLRKDLGLALESAKVSKVPLFMTAQAYQYFTRATAEGLGKKDMSVLIELLEKTVGVEVRKGEKMQNDRPKLAIVMGDATGIGPEIVAKSLCTEETRRLCRPAVVGDARVMMGAIQLTKAPLRIVPRKKWEEVSGETGLLEMFDLANLDPKDYKMGEVSPRAGKACLEYLEWTLPQVLAGPAQAIVFAPLNKQAMRLGGSPYSAELAHFAHLTKTELYGEINALDPLWTSRVTSHIGFREICAQLTPEKILQAIALLHQTMGRAGVAHPRIGVAALNPHGGEGGLLGREEETLIQPAMARARQEGMDVQGPFPADTIFVRARRGEFSGVVTMFHDQGQIATKLLGFDRGVTVAGGLPVVIATPAHGTAHDIAGKGIADVGAFQAALRIAVRMAQSSKP